MFSSFTPSSFVLHALRFSDAVQHASRTQIPLQASPAVWRWTDIAPSRQLIWSPCFVEYQCARLDVPLDWQSPSDDERVVLAIIKLPATNLSDYRGAVITNPGGPGGSGVYSLKDHGKALQKVVGTNHDIISFDPRGVGATTPSVDCWSSKVSRDVWTLQDVGVIDAHEGVLYDEYARATASSRACIKAQGNNQTEKHILSYVGTASVARDMLEILQKGSLGKLKYWGFSYGTYLGLTFAALYPDQVGRMVNDGNVDHAEWSTNTHMNFLHDSDKIMSSFYYFCHVAGPSRCAFYSRSPEDIENRLKAVLQNLRKHPVIVDGQGEDLDLPEIVTYSSIQRLISASLYRPILMFPFLAHVLASLEAGDGIPYHNLTTDFGMHPGFSFQCKNSEAPIVPPDIDGSDEASRAIQCADGGAMTDTVEEFESYAKELMSRGRSAGAVASLFRMACAGYTVKSSWRFQGPFEGNTSHPILFVANAADNVTPLRSAIKNAAGFPNSSILVQNSFGHSSLSAPSLCTTKHIRNYFQDGVLPQTGTVCEPETTPFAEYKDADIVDVSEDDRQLKDATWGLMKGTNYRSRSKRLF